MPRLSQDAAANSSVPIAALVVLIVLSTVWPWTLGVFVLLAAALAVHGELEHNRRAKRD